MQIKKTKKPVTASNAQQTARNTADYMRNKLIDAGYSKDEVKGMGLKELKEACDKEDINIVYSCGDVNSSKKYDAAQKHIKAAIDILAKCGKDDIVAKDNIANLSVVMFDLMGEDQ